MSRIKAIHIALGIIPLSVILTLTTALLISPTVQYRSIKFQLQAVAQYLDKEVWGFSTKALQNISKNTNLIKTSSGLMKPGNNKTTRLLNQLKEFSQSSIAYLINTQGITVASSFYDGTKSLLGKNYSFRPYFSEVLINKEPHLYIAVGVTTQKRGIYIASPIIDHKQNLIGVLVLKQNIDRIERILQLHPTPVSLVTKDGIIFASNKKDWIYHSVYPLDKLQRSRVKRSKQFSDHEILPLGVNFHKKNIQIEQAQYLVTSLKIPHGQWSLYGLYHNRLIPLHLTGLIFFILIITLYSIFFALYYFLRLKNSEHRFRSLFQKSNTPYLMIEGERIVDVNETAANMLGATPSDIIGKYPREISPEYQPNGTLSSIASYRRMQEAMKKGFTRFEWLHQTTQGEPFWVEVSLTTLDINGKIILFTSWYDIDEQKKIKVELKQSQDRLTGIINNSSQVFFSATTDYQFTYLSPHIYSLLGLPRNSAVRTWKDITTMNKVNEETIIHNIKMLNRGDPRKQYELELFHSSGKKIIAEIREAPIIENGVINSIVGSINDITLQRQTTDKLEQMLIETKRVNNLMLGREERIIEMKREVNSLYKEQGKDPKYKIPE